MTGIVAERGPDVCLERVLTTRLIEPHLGRPGVALDLAGGTGPYAVWLLELGWEVRGWADGTVFDAVVALEPLSHPRGDDVRALARLTRPGGVVALTITPVPFFLAPGFEKVTLASTHGFMTGAEAALEAVRLVDPDGYRTLLDRLVATADDPHVRATADQLLYVGRRSPR